MGQSSKELPEAVQQKISDVRQVLENLHRIAVEQETELDVLRAKNEELQRAIEEKKAAYDALSAQAAGEREKLRVSLDAMNEELKKIAKIWRKTEEIWRKEKRLSKRKKISWMKTVNSMKGITANSYRRRMLSKKKRTSKAI